MVVVAMRQELSVCCSCRHVRHKGVHVVVTGMYFSGYREAVPVLQLARFDFDMPALNPKAFRFVIGSLYASACRVLRRR
jgi:hypothetical protein